MALGHRTVLGIGEESVYGTPVARTRFQKINSESIDDTEPPLVSPALLDVGVDTDRLAQGPRSIAGDVTFNPEFTNGFPLLLEAAMGGATTSSQPNTTDAPTAFRHTLTLGDEPNFLTLEIDKGVADDGEAHVIEGAKITSTTFTAPAGALCEASFSYVAEDLVPSPTATAPVFIDSELLQTMTTTTQFLYNSVAQQVRSVSFTIANTLMEDRRTLGSRLIREPVRGGKRLVTGSFDHEFSEDLIFDDYQAFTERTIQLQIAGSTIGGSITFLLDATFQLSHITAGTPHADSEGIIVVTYEWTGYKDDTFNETSIQLTNEESTIS